MSLTDTLLTHLKHDENDNSQPILLHPYCGMATWTEAIGKTLRMTTFGIEPNDASAWKARTILTNLVHGEPEDSIITPGCVSLLILNRLHCHVAPIITTLAPGLMGEGIFVLMIGIDQISKRLARWLVESSPNWKVYRAATTEGPGRLIIGTYTATTQTWTSAEETRVHKTLLTADHDFEPVPTPEWTIPPSNGTPVECYSKTLDLRALRDAMVHSEIWHNPTLLKQISGQDHNIPQPLLPPKPGHLALHIAAGILNGRVIQYKDAPTLLKGRTIKVIHTSEDEELDPQGNAVPITRKRETFATAIQGLNLRTGTLYKIQ